MRLKLAGLVILTTMVSPAMAGITVTSYTTIAGTNAFAPVGGTKYIAQQMLVDISPAHAEVSADWMGPNAGGTVDTWHWVATSQISSTTAFNANSYTVTAGGSFAYELDTTTDFIDPRSSSIFSPRRRRELQWLLQH